MRYREQERGWILGLVVVTAVAIAAMAYAALVWGLHLARLSGSLTFRKVQARYAAEGGIAWAMQRLMKDPQRPFPEGDVDLQLNGMNVDIVLPPCPTAGTPCRDRKLQAKVVY